MIIFYGVTAMIIAAALLYFGGKLAVEWFGQSRSPSPASHKSK
jgi:hypothetical protein